MVNGVTETLFFLNHMKEELMLGFCLLAFFLNSRNIAITSYTYEFAINFFGEEKSKVMWTMSVKYT